MPFDLNIIIYKNEKAGVTEMDGGLKYWQDKRKQRLKKNWEGKRYLLLDAFRGLSIINMIAFHFLYDYYVIFGRNVNWWKLPEIRLWQSYICMSFIILSGFVWKWGRKSNLKRGIFLNICGLAVSLVTYAAVPDSAVWFGILNFIGCAVLLMIPLDIILKKIPAVPGIFISLFLFILSYDMQLGYLSLGSVRIAKIPDFLYDIKILTPLGFPYPEFFSGDYFPILPWTFLYMVGYFMVEIFEKQETWKRIGKTYIPVLSWMGQKSIWIYLIHQPICMVICQLFFG